MAHFHPHLSPPLSSSPSLPGPLNMISTEGITWWFGQAEDTFKKRREVLSLQMQTM